MTLVLIERGARVGMPVSARLGGHLGGWYDLLDPVDGRRGFSIPEDCVDAASESVQRGERAVFRVTAYLAGREPGRYLLRSHAGAHALSFSIPAWCVDAEHIERAPAEELTREDWMGIDGTLAMRLGEERAARLCGLFRHLAAHAQAADLLADTSVRTRLRKAVRQLRSLTGTSAFDAGLGGAPLDVGAEQAAALRDALTAALAVIPHVWDLPGGGA